ncbi:MAG: hypothetical protein QXG05_07835 [Nitrososphaerota archaeon]
MSGTENRDRELENLMGQFLVASFQSSKLADMIYERFSFRSTPKELRLVLTNSLSESNRPPLLLTIRIEQLTQHVPKPEIPKSGQYRIIGIFESPPLDLSDVKESVAQVEEMFAGSLRWWSNQGMYSDLKLSEWKSFVSALKTDERRKFNRLYRVFQILQAPE